MEDGRWRWLILTGALVGFGFLTKQLQVMLVVPPLAITYLAFGPGPCCGGCRSVGGGTRCVDRECGLRILAVEFVAGLVASVYIGGSQNNLDPRTDVGLQRDRPAQR